MQYIDIRNCLLETTNLMCPACQNTLLQKIIPDGTVNSLDFKYYFICPNLDCKFVGSPDVIQTEIIYQRFAAYNIQLLDFMTSILHGFDPLNVTFDIFSIGVKFDNYTWSFGDGSTQSTGLTQITHTYLIPGTYTVSVTAIDKLSKQTFSCAKIALITVSKYLSPVANFTVDKVSGNNKLEVQCTDTSTGSMIQSWNWNFGDGVTSTEQNPKHLYTHPGIYTITLKVTNSKNQTSTITKPNIINVQLTPPVAKFKQSHVAGYAPLTVTFEYTGTDEYIVDTFKWIFGDGTISNEQNPVHTYASAGIYNVQLEVYNSVGSDALFKPNCVYVEASKIG